MGSSAADVLNKFDSIHHLVPFYPITDFNCKSEGGSHTKKKKEKRNLQPLITSHYYFIQGFPQKKPL